MPGIFGGNYLKIIVKWRVGSGKWRVVIWSCKAGLLILLIHWLNRMN